jgi:putative transcriptional regulator
VFRAGENPPGALRVIDDVSFALDPAVVERLLHAPPRRVRFFNGYAGWAPGQLALELAGGGWYVLNADANTVFRDNMDTLWEELLLRARAVIASLP